jgi:protein required for attachment to host cells
MKRACIAIIDAVRARIYTYDAGERTDDADQALREEVDLINPGRRGHDLFSTSKSGPKHPAPGSGTTDDHRDGHFAELEHRFACQVVDDVKRIAGERGLDQVLLVATPKMLGVLRSVDAPLRAPGQTLQYVERDLAQLTSPQIHDHLAQLQLIDPRRRHASAPR